MKKMPARMRDVVLKQVYPPIPIRSYDWCAWHDGQEEGNTGWGATPEEALADLAELDEDRCESGVCNDCASKGESWDAPREDGTCYVCGKGDRTMKILVQPQVNLNGTERAELVKQQHAVLVALRLVHGTMAEAMPHGRDYQWRPEEYRPARDAWIERIELIESLIREIEHHAETIQNI